MRARMTVFNFSPLLFLLFVAEVSISQIAEASEASDSPCTAALENRQALYQTVFSSEWVYAHFGAKYATEPHPARVMSLNENQFHVNAETAAVLREKARLVAHRRERIIQVIPRYKSQVRAALNEQFALMLEELPMAFPEAFAREGETLIQKLSGQRLAKDELAKIDDATEALHRLGQLVAEDLILVRPFGPEHEFRIVAGHLAFPTHWALDFTLGQSITQIHKQVGESRQAANDFAKMINQVLWQRLRSSAQIIHRNNWTIEFDPRLALPAYLRSPYPAPARYTRGNIGDSGFLRIERQTLRGLPESGLVLFAIQPMVFPLKEVFAHRALAAEIHKGIGLKYGQWDPGTLIAATEAELRRQLFGAHR